jgi:hypothetical protein
MPPLPGRVQRGGTIRIGEREDLGRTMRAAAFEDLLREGRQTHEVGDSPQTILGRNLFPDEVARHVTEVGLRGQFRRVEEEEVVCRHPIEDSEFDGVVGSVGGLDLKPEGIRVDPVSDCPGESGSVARGRPPNAEGCGSRPVGRVAPGPCWNGCLLPGRNGVPPGPGTGRMRIIAVPGYKERTPAQAPSFASIGSRIPAWPL